MNRLRTRFIGGGACSIVLLVLMVAASSLLVVAPHKALAANPGLINFQGKVTNADGTNVATNSYPFNFRLYTVSSAGSAIWSENSKTVTVTAGVFQTSLGSACSFSVANACNNNTPIDFNTINTLYLGITFNNDAAGEMSPRVQMSSVPYAFNADRLGGLDSAGFIRNQTGQQASSNFNISGSGTLGTALITSSTGSFDLLNTNVATINAFAATATLNLGATTGTSIAPRGALTFNEANDKTLTVASTLTAARTLPLMVVSQANNATFNSSGALLSLSDLDTGSTGTLLNISSDSAGALAVIDTTNAAANGMSIDVQSSSASQFAFQVTTSNGLSQTLQVRADGATFFGTPPATTVYTAAPINATKAADSTMVTQMNLINGFGGLGAGSAIDFYTYTDAGNGVPGARFAVVDDGLFSGGFTFFTKTQDANGSILERMRISSTGEVGIGNAAPGANKLAVSYTGANSATEASGVRVDYAPGATSGGTANGLQIVANATGAVTGVTENGIKLEGPASPGAGTETGLNITTGWDVGVNVQSGGLQLSEMANPSTTPAANTMRVYAKDVSGRTMLKALSPAGVDYAYQPSLFQQFVMLTTPGNNATANAVTMTGSLATVSGTNSLIATSEAQGPMGNWATAATNGSVAGVSTNTTIVTRGSTATGANGFFYFARISLPDALTAYTAATGSRMFFGLSDQTLATALATDNPTGNRVGFVFSGALTETTFRLGTRNGTTDTRTNTAVTLAINKTYDLYFYCGPQCASITWRIDNLTDGTAPVEGTVSATLPSTTAGLRSMVGITALTTTARNLRWQRFYTESDR